MKKNERLIEKNLFVSFAHIFWSNDDIFVKLWTTEGLSVFLQGKHLALTEFGITMERNCWKKERNYYEKKNTKSLRKETEQAKNKETKDNKTTTTTQEHIYY